MQAYTDHVQEARPHPSQSSETNKTKDKKGEEAVKLPKKKTVDYEIETTKLDFDDSMFKQEDKIKNEATGK